jgi:DNA mismatch repair ATPase MutL
LKTKIKKQKKTFKAMKLISIISFILLISLIKCIDIVDDPEMADYVEQSLKQEIQQQQQIQQQQKVQQQQQVQHQQEVLQQQQQKQIQQQYAQLRSQQQALRRSNDMMFMHMIPPQFGMTHLLVPSNGPLSFQEKQQQHRESFMHLKEQQANEEERQRDLMNAQEFHSISFDFFPFSSIFPGLDQLLSVIKPIQNQQGINYHPNTSHELLKPLEASLIF